VAGTTYYIRYQGTSSGVDGCAIPPIDQTLAAAEAALLNDTANSTSAPPSVALRCECLRTLSGGWRVGVWYRPSAAMVLVKRFTVDSPNVVYEADHIKSTYRSAAHTAPSC
jgi:hypothetical protein